MASTINIVTGAVCVVLGLLWIARPVTMSRLQQRFLFLGAGGDDVDFNPTLGRVAGGVLTVFGLYLAIAP